MGLLNVVNIGVVSEPICFHKKENAMKFVGIAIVPSLKLWKRRSSRHGPFERCKHRGRL